MLKVAPFALTLLVALSFALGTCAIDSSTPFVNNATLISPDQYLLYWNYTNENITFKLVVKNAKWVGFALSPNGGMDKSDAVVAFQNPDGSANFTGRSIFGRKPTVDTVQHVTLLYMSTMNNYTTVIFTRKIRLCANSSNSTDINRDIISGSQYFIFSYGTSFDTDGDITYHGPNNRGSIVLAPLNTLNEVVNLNMTEINTIDFSYNTTLINNSTTEYYCHMFKIPDNWTETKQHVVRYESLFSENSKKYVHHWLLYECSESYETVYLNSTNGTSPEPGTCFSLDQYQTSNAWDDVSNYCQRISLLWSVGSPSVYDFASNMAYPFGGPRNFKYFYLQIHYNNPTMDQNVTDSFGLRLYYTEVYRPIEIGVLTHGTVSDWRGIIIPPGMSSMTLDYYCRSDSLQDWFPASGNVTVFAVLPHTHLAGTQVYLKQIRNGTEINYLGRSNSYNFDYQTIEYLQQPIVVSKGDELRTTCVYQSVNKTGYILGGPRTSNEMCLNFLWYYPRNQDYSYCYDIPSLPDTYYFMSILNSTGEITINGTLNDDNIYKALISATPTSKSATYIPQYYSMANRSNYFDTNATMHSHDYLPYTPIAITDPPCIPNTNQAIKPAWVFVNILIVAISTLIQALL